VEAEAQAMVQEARQRAATMRHEAQKLIDAARQEAETLLAEARQEASADVQKQREEIEAYREESENLRKAAERAKESAREEGLKVGQTEAYEQGFAEGKAEAYEAYAEALRPEIEVMQQQFGEMLQQADTVLAPMQAQAEEFLVRFSLEIAKKILGKEVQIPREVLQRAVSTVIAGVLEEPSLHLRVHPQSLQRYQRELPYLKKVLVQEKAVNSREFLGLSLIQKNVYELLLLKGILKETAILRRTKDIKLILSHYTQNPPFALFMADVMGLKAINDTYGRKYGDLLIKNAQEFLEHSFREYSSSRPSDTVLRYGLKADEFLAIAESTNERKARIIEARLKNNMKDWIIQPLNKQLQLHLGHSIYTTNSSIEELLEQADLAMIRNKNTFSK